MTIILMLIIGAFFFGNYLGYLMARADFNDLAKITTNSIAHADEMLTTIRELSGLDVTTKEGGLG